MGFEETFFEGDLQPLQITPIYDCKKCIIFCLDDDYVKFFSVLLSSFLDHCKAGEKYDLIILCDSMGHSNMDKIKQMLSSNISVRTYDPSALVQMFFSNTEMGPQRYWSKVIFYKCFIPLVTRLYERAVYLDSDMIINGPVDELLSYELDGEMIAAVEDVSIPYLVLNHDKKRVRYMQKIGIREIRSYFNSGLIVFSNKDIDIKWYLKRLKKMMFDGNYLYPDQDILNVIFQDIAKILPFRYNYQVMFGTDYEKLLSEAEGEDRYREYKEASDNPVIIHYIGSDKPWTYKQREKSDIFWYYAERTSFFDEIVDNYKVKGLSLKSLTILIKRFLLERCPKLLFILTK